METPTIDFAGHGSIPIAVNQLVQWSTIDRTRKFRIHSGRIMPKEDWRYDNGKVHFVAVMDEDDYVWLLRPSRLSIEITVATKAA